MPAIDSRDIRAHEAVAYADGSGGHVDCTSKSYPAECHSADLQIA